MTTETRQAAAPRPLSRAAEVALTKLATLNSGTPNLELAVLRVPSIVEAYVDNLDTLSAEYVKGDTDFQRAVEAMTVEKLHQDWNSRREWLRGSFHIDISEDAASQEFFLLVDLRNALSHGDEGLTRAQRRTITDQLFLEGKLRTKLHALVDGRRIVLSNETGAAAIRVGSRYIFALDARAAPELVRRRLV